MKCICYYCKTCIQRHVGPEWTVGNVCIEAIYFIDTSMPVLC